MTSYRGKVVVITGGANGLGKSLAARLHDEGAVTVLLDRDENALKKITPLKTERIFRHVVDVSKRDDVEVVKDAISRELGKIDVLINNAAVSHTGTVTEMEASHFEWVIQTNLLGTYNCCKIFLPLLLKNTTSRIVNISSGIAFRGLPKFSAYASSKAAIHTFSQALGAELMHSGVQVCTVFPGPIKTHIPERSRHVKDSYRINQLDYLHQKGYDPDEVARRILKNLPRNKQSMLIGWEVKMGALMARWSPGLLNYLIRKNPHWIPV